MLLDAGGSFPTTGYSRHTAGIIAKIVFESMDHMNYHAVNLSWRDLLSGLDKTNEIRSTISVPMITSNLDYASSRSNFGKKYVIRNVGGIRAGILGIMSEERFGNILDESIRESLTISSPEKVVAELVPEIRKSSDVVILLSSMGYSETSRLLEKVSGIDLAISSGNDSEELTQCGKSEEYQSVSEKLNGTLLLPARKLGNALGYVKIDLGPSGGSVLKMENKEIELAMDVALDPELERISGADVYLSATKEIEKYVEEARRKMEQNISTVKNMTPEEYLKHLSMEKEQSGKGIRQERKNN